MRSPLQAVQSVALAQVEKMLTGSAADVRRIFSAQELEDAGEGAARVAHLAGRLAAKQACTTLFPCEWEGREPAVGDFVIVRDGYGAPQLVVDAQVQRLLDHYRFQSISLSVTHDATRASAVAVAEQVQTPVPFVGKLIYYLLPFRRGVIVMNLRRVFGSRIPEREVIRLAQAHYAHYVRMAFEFLQYPRLPEPRRAALVRVENQEVLMQAVMQGRGVLIVTAHLGNWEVATVGGIENFPQLRGRFHIVRRNLWPRLLYDVMANRLQQAGVGILFKKGSLDRLLQRLAGAEVVVFVLDQHAGARDGVEVQLFGHPAWVFRSPAVIARSSGAAVVPATSWREPDGRHVIRFEAAIPFVDCEDPDEGIRRNMQAYMTTIERFMLRHPEQWGMWMHRLWKGAPSAVTQPLSRRLVRRVRDVLHVEG